MTGIKDNWLALPPRSRSSTWGDALFAALAIFILIFCWPDPLSILVGAFIIGCTFGKWFETSVHIPVSEAALLDAMAQDLVRDVNAEVGL